MSSSALLSSLRALPWILLLPLSLRLGPIASAQTNVFPATGNVGIGTTNPDAKLTFGPSTGEQVKTIHANGVHGLTAVHYSGGAFLIMRSQDSWNERVRISADPTATSYINSGNFGLGTTAPRARLEIVDLPSSSGANAAQIFLKGGNGGGTAYSGIRFSMLEHSTGWGADIQGFDDTSVYGGALVFRTGGGSATVIPTERMRISSSGNVGMGTSTPGEKLSVVGKVSSTGLVVDSLADGEGFYFKRGTFQGWNGGAYSDNTFRINQAGVAARLLIDSSGNVGIGTTSPTHKLSVNGTVRAKEVIVETTGWADYVFAPDYALPTLAETEQHIAEHGHLPGIPSATEVAEQGVSVGELQMKLLQKLEEMTLHQIQMQKDVQALKAENQALQTQIKRLSSSSP